MSKKKGYKITEFLEGARNCDAENENDVKSMHEVSEKCT